MKKIYINLLLVLVVFMFMTGTACKLTEVQEEVTPPAATDYQALFNTSGHSDSTSEAFVHWDEDDPAMVPTGCAKCHSLGGFLDFAADGIVDADATPGPFDCNLCHTDSATGARRQLSSVTFPSGNSIGGLGDEGICMQCHQGRYSGTGVKSYLAGKGPTSGDVVNPSLGFRNVHYFATGATLYGKQAAGGYQYKGQSYDVKFAHVKSYDSCTGCHDPHTLQIKSAECAGCHTTGGSFNAHDIRYKGSLVDYDGDGDITEGIYYEITTLQGLLIKSIGKYTKDVSGFAAVYDSHTYPYFFKDNNGNGKADADEANYGNQYKLWTPRSLKASYNYQFSLKDPGAFAHNAKYVIQLLYDSLMSLKEGSTKVILPSIKRDDEGHFKGSAEAWRHWDGDGEVQASCAKCHSADGLPVYLEHGEIDEGQPISNGMACSTCHTNVATGAVRDVKDVKFPSGDVVSLGDNSNLCMNCHQGRASKHTIDQKIASSNEPYSFSNIHYIPAAAVLFGTEVKGGYEYPRKTYTGRQMFAYHGGKFDSCVECHMGIKGASSYIGHNVHKPNPADCIECHGRDDSQPNRGYDVALFKFSGIRPASTPDYNGNGDTKESIKAEIRALEAKLYAQLQTHSAAIGAPLIYDSHTYPYFFKDKNGNGSVDPGEASYSNGYRFTGILLKAAYNYQMSVKEPHGYIHNSLYVAQLLVDSIEDLGGNVSAYTWR